jgi:hypothetical protein
MLCYSLCTIMCCLICDKGRLLLYRPLWLTQSESAVSCGSVGYCRLQAVSVVASFVKAGSPFANMSMGPAHLRLSHNSRTDVLTTTCGMQTLLCMVLRLMQCTCAQLMVMSLKCVPPWYGEPVCLAHPAHSVATPVQVVLNKSAHVLIGAELDAIPGVTLVRGFSEELQLSCYFSCSGDCTFYTCWQCCEPHFR